MPFGNTVEPECVLGASIAARAMELLEEADRQYSRLLWEYEGGELAVDADSTYLTGGRMPQTTRRLFRSLNTGADFYHVFNPDFRDGSLRAGLNELCGGLSFLRSVLRNHQRPGAEGDDCHRNCQCKAEAFFHCEGNSKYTGAGTGGAFGHYELLGGFSTRRSGQADIGPIIDGMTAL